MKNKILIAIAVFCFSKATAQTHNELIWKYASDHIGQKVGNGDCYELIKYAYKTICNCKIKQRASLRKYYFYFGREIPKDSVMEGDIVAFQYFDKKTGNPLYGHIGVVYSVSETNMSIASQNYETDSRRKSKVVITVFKDITNVGPDITQIITFYRPF